MNWSRLACWGAPTLCKIWLYERSVKAPSNLYDAQKDARRRQPVQRKTLRAGAFVSPVNIFSCRPRRQLDCCRPPTHYSFSFPLSISIKLGGAVPLCSARACLVPA